MAFEDVRCTMVVDLDAIAWNAKELRRRAGGLRMLAVQKADAYGLGAAGVAPVLRENGASLFGAATLPEALSLLPHGLPVMMLGGPLPEEIPEAVAAGIILPAAGYELAKLIDDCIGTDYRKDDRRLEDFFRYREDASVLYRFRRLSCCHYFH